MILRLLHDKHPDMFRHVNRLTRAAGLPGYAPRQISAFREDVNIFCLLLELPRFQRPPVGFILYRLILPEAEVYDLAVNPLWHKRGIGGILLRAARRHMIQAGAEECHLEVRRSNETARRFYSRHGFRTCGTRRAYYTGPTEDAILLNLRLLPESDGDGANFPLIYPPKR
jgi:ribosomal-protein-alanine acetyltransferase